MSQAQTFILDAWPIVEWLLGKQPAARKFTLFLNASELAGTRLLITRINQGEILYTLAKRLSEDEALAKVELKRLFLELVSIDDGLVDQATELKKAYACSYADCFAAALAIREGAPLVTGDQEFRKLSSDGLLDMVWLGA